MTIERVGKIIGVVVPFLMLNAILWGLGLWVALPMVGMLVFSLHSLLYLGWSLSLAFEKVSLELPSASERFQQSFFETARFSLVTFFAAPFVSIYLVFASLKNVFTGQGLRSAFRQANSWIVKTVRPIFFKSVEQERDEQLRRQFPGLLEKFQRCHVEINTDKSPDLKIKPEFSRYLWENQEMTRQIFDIFNHLGDEWFNHSSNQMLIQLLKNPTGWMALQQEEKKPVLQLLTSTSIWAGQWIYGYDMSSKEKIRHLWENPKFCENFIKAFDFLEKKLFPGCKKNDPPLGKYNLLMSAPHFVQFLCENPDALESMVNQLDSLVDAPLDGVVDAPSEDERNQKIIDALKSRLLHHCFVTSHKIWQPDLVNNILDQKEIDLKTTCGNSQETVLHALIKARLPVDVRIEFMKKFIERDPELLKSRDRDGNTVLHTLMGCYQNPEQNQYDLAEIGKKILAWVRIKHGSDCSRELVMSQNDKGQKPVGMLDEVLKGSNPKDGRDNNTFSFNQELRAIAGNMPDEKKVEIFFNTIDGGDLNQVKSFIQENQEEEWVRTARDKHDNNAVHRALDKGHLKLAVWLLDQREPLAKSINVKGRPPEIVLDGLDFFECIDDIQCLRHRSLAIRKPKNLPIFHYLVELWSGYSPEKKAANAANLKRVLAMLPNDEINKRHEGLPTPMLMACQLADASEMKDISMIKALYDIGGLILDDRFSWSIGKIREQQKEGSYTLLRMMAEAPQHFEPALYLAFFQDPSTGHGDPPLRSAVRSNNQNFFEAFIDSKANMIIHDQLINYAKSTQSIKDEVEKIRTELFTRCFDFGPLPEFYKSQLERLSERYHAIKKEIDAYLRKEVLSGRLAAVNPDDEKQVEDHDLIAQNIREYFTDLGINIEPLFAAVSEHSQWRKSVSLTLYELSTGPARSLMEEPPAEVRAIIFDYTC